MKGFGGERGVLVEALAFLQLHWCLNGEKFAHLNPISVTLNSGPRPPQLSFAPFLSSPLDSSLRARAWRLLLSSALRALGPKQSNSTHEVEHKSGMKGNLPALKTAPTLPGQLINASTLGGSVGSREGTHAGEGVIHRVTFPAGVKFGSFRIEPSRGLPRADLLQQKCVCSNGIS